MRAEAQQTITTQMGETVTVLLQELEEERAEGTRKDSETGEEDKSTHQHINASHLQTAFIPSAILSSPSCSFLSFILNFMLNSTIHF
jgi:hypothetical protein